MALNRKYEIIPTIYKPALLLISLILVTVCIAQNVASKNLWDDEKLYTAIDNEIDIAIPSIKSSLYTITVNRGNISGENGHYIYRVGTAGPMVLQLIHKNGTLLFEKTYDVYEFPTPSLCLESRGKYLKPENFMKPVWAKNPLNYYDKLEIKEMVVNYIQAGNYIGQKYFTTKTLKNAYFELSQVNANKIWVESFKYVKPNGSISTVKKPTLCNCRSENYLTLAPSKPKSSIDRIVIKAYPTMYVSMGNKGNGLILIPDLLQQTKLKLHSTTTNLFGFKITSFDMNIRRTNGKIERFSVNNENLSAEMLKAIKNIQEGDVISISNVSIQNSFKSMYARGVKMIAETE